MSGLVKWRPGTLTPGSKMDAALAELQQTKVTQPTPRSHVSTRALASHAGEVRDAIRRCSINKKLWAARYIAGADGRFYYSQSIKITEALYLEQYADSNSNVQPLQSHELAEEFCAWCGGHGHGSVRCGRCGQEICYGKVVGRYFRCHEDCGGQGTMVPEARTQASVKPGPAHKSGYSAK